MIAVNTLHDFKRPQPYCWFNPPLLPAITQWHGYPYYEYSYYNTIDSYILMICVDYNFVDYR